MVMGVQLNHDIIFTNGVAFSYPATTMTSYIGFPRVPKFNELFGPTKANLWITHSYMASHIVYSYLILTKYLVRADGIDHYTFKNEYMHRQGIGFEALDISRIV